MVNLFSCRFVTGGRLPLAFAILAVAAGCGEDGPKVYMTKGKVAFKGSGEIATQLQGCYIYMQQVEDPTITAVSEIDLDGTFVLGSAIAGRPYQGLPPGTYRTRISPTTAFGKPVISPRYEKFTTSKLQYTVEPRSSEITIEVERAGR